MHWAHPIQSVVFFNDLSGPIQYSQHNIFKELWADSEPLAPMRLGPYGIIGHSVLKRLWAHPTPLKVFAWLSRMHWAHPIPSVITFNDLPGSIRRGQHNILRRSRAKSEPSAPTCLGPCNIIGSGVLKHFGAHPAPSEGFAWLSKMHWTHPIQSVMALIVYLGPSSAVNITY